MLTQAEQEEPYYERVICKECGKLLFKTRKLQAQCPQPPQYSIEIKCYNHKCKLINRITI